MTDLPDNFGEFSTHADDTTVEIGEEIPYLVSNVGSENESIGGGRMKLLNPVSQRIALKRLEKVLENSDNGQDALIIEVKNKLSIAIQKVNK